MLQSDLFGAATFRAPTRPMSEAQARKLNGQFRAATKAGSLWMELTMEKLKAFVRVLRAEHGDGLLTQEFTFERFRVWAEANGLPPPASLNAWGAVPMAAKRAGICQDTGRAEPAKRAESHGRLVRVWRLL